LLSFSRKEKKKLKNSKKTEIAIIGGTGFADFLKNGEQIRVGTPYGLPPPMSTGQVDGRDVAFLPRHGPHHSIPPHKVNYRANIYALRRIGVKCVLATNAVGAINTEFKPGDLVIPHDLIDFTKFRQPSFYEEAPVTHVDVTQLYCPEMRDLLIKESKKRSARVWNRSVLVCTEGPRYETPAEIEMFRRLGADVVSMTGTPEAVLARELEMCYATLCFVTNMAAGIQARLTARELSEVAEEKIPIVQQVLRETIGHLPKTRICPCAHALEEARLEVE
jgi:5'-methylthioadenosine phosphorylase